MIIYAIIILLTTILAYMVTVVEKKTKNKVIIYLLKILAILFPSIIAGIRFGVGTDYLGVYEPFFEEVLNGNIAQRSREFEIGYVLINRIVILFGGNFNIVMFICSLITNAFIYLGLDYYKDKINVPLAYFFYMILFYQRTFNLVRQMMSIAIVFYAFKFLDIKDREEETKREYIFYIIKQIIKYLSFVIIASLFQRTTLIMLAIPCILFVYRKPKYKILKISSYIILLTIILNFSVIGDLLSKSEKLKYYAFYFSKKGATSLSITYLIRILPSILPYFLLRKEIDKDEQISMLYGVNIIGCILILLAYFTNTYGERIALFFNIFQVILFSYYITKLKTFNKKKVFWVVSTSIILVNCVIWYNDYILKGRDETLPYRTIFSKEYKEHKLNEG